jgi:hypothetical protein
MQDVDGGIEIGVHAGVIGEQAKTTREQFIGSAAFYHVDTGFDHRDALL